MACGKCRKNKIASSTSSRIDKTPKIKIPPIKSGCGGTTSYNPPIPKNINRIEKKKQGFRP